MSRYHSYLNTAEAILRAYHGEEPFASFIKKYFAAYKKYGSKDRKYISHLCYCYFRLGKAARDVSMQEKIISALFLCSDKRDELLEQLRPEWNAVVSMNTEEKINRLETPFSVTGIFPWKDLLSDGIDHEFLCHSYLRQPDLFLRVRPGRLAVVKKKLEAAAIGFEEIKENCIALSNATKIDDILDPDRDAVVQDLNSQQTGTLLQLSSLLNKPNVNVWDCCAASGGKSIMATDLLHQPKLTVSDNRESILINLRKRFAEAGIKNYKSFVADLSKPVDTSLHHSFDLLIADVPCTGSGTWGRTPEQLFTFDPGKITGYATLQQTIIKNITPAIAPGGFLLYITCSVFREENEKMVELIKQNLHFQLVKMEVLKGYDKKADTMFAALLQLPL